VAILDRRGEIIEEMRRELETQFKRMAQIQSELDEVRSAWLKARN
jgi:ribosomal protein S3